MSPNSVSTDVKTCGNDSDAKKDAFKPKIVWRNVAALGSVHLMALWGYYLIFQGYGHYKTYLFTWFMAVYGGFGITAGAHRLWCHRSYKAKWPLRLILALAQTIAIQNDIFEWARDHRVHHKYSETDADPHNSHRGFFFAHVGWLLCKKHPDVKAKGKSIDMSDLWADPIVRFQRQFYIPLVAFFSAFLPVYIPMFFWGETFYVSFFVNLLRYALELNNTWFVNSAAHIYGMQPYNKEIRPRENFLVSYLSFGEGYHNYHHTFPWDYSTSEYGWSEIYNPTTAFIDFFALIGWAYDRKKTSESIIETRKQRTGDVNHKLNIPPAIVRLIVFSITTFSTLLMVMWPMALRALLRAVIM